MAQTTIEKVTEYFSKENLTEFGIGNSQLQNYIDDAFLQVQMDRIPENYFEYAQRLWVCHMIYLNVQQSNSDVTGVALEQVGPLKTQYFSYNGSTSNSGDRYEVTYYKLLNSLGLRGNVFKFV